MTKEQIKLIPDHKTRDRLYKIRKRGNRIYDKAMKNKEIRKIYYKKKRMDLIKRAESIDRLKYPKLYESLYHRITWMYME